MLYTDYIHYAFVDYGSGGSIAANFNSKKVSKDYLGENEKGGKLLNKFNTEYKESMISNGDLSEYGEILDFFESPDDFLKDINISYADVQSTSVRQMLSREQLTTSPEKIAEVVSDFLSKFEEVLNEMIQQLGINKTNLDAFKKAVISDYASKRNVAVGSSKFAQSVLNDLLAHQGIVKLNLAGGDILDTEGAKGVQNVLKACVLAVKALPEYGTAGSLTMGSALYSTGKTVKTSSRRKRTADGVETLQILVGKLQGLFSNVVGMGGEVAAQAALSEALEKLQESLDEKIEEKTKGFFQGKNFGFEVTRSGSIKVDDKAREVKSVSKPDVTVSVTDGKVTITYGATVKRYKADAKGNVKSVSLVKGYTDFYSALLRYVNDCGSSSAYALNYVYNVAAGRDGKTARSDHANRGTISKTELNDKWQQIKDSVVISNFLHFLSGIEGASSLLMIMNTKVVPVSQMLSGVLKSSNIQSRLYNEINGKNKTLTRAQMYRSNAWKSSSAKKSRARTGQNKDRAQERSEEAKENIISLMRSAKLDVSLKDIANIGLFN